MRPLTGFREFQRFLASFTNYERLPTFRYDSQTLGLERMRRFARDLGDPQNAYPSVHVGGTKGKGTTTLILEALLSADGMRIGTYTSPHVEHLRERIRVGGAPISKGDLVATANATMPALESRLDSPEFPTFFELMTAIAMLHFSKEAVDYAIFEVGLGGRLDATNILSARWSALTSVGLEHTELLGHSLAAIAGEKAGIIRPLTPVICGELPAEARDVVTAVAEKRGAPVIETRSADVVVGPNGTIKLEGLDRPLRALRVLGPGLRADLAIAWTLYRRIIDDDDRVPDFDTVQRVLDSLELPARVEMFDSDPPVCLDSAHTTESIDALAIALDEIQLPRPRTLVFSLSSDKRCDEILARLDTIADDVIFTLADSTRSLPPTTLRDTFGRGEVVDDPNAALDAAIARGKPVVIAGSIYLAGCLRPRLRG
jgi:dihydrofolate synthase/folylpolyglutamate synthase